MKITVMLSLFLLAFNALALTECLRPVQAVWNDETAGNDSVYITFSDGGGAVFKFSSQVSAGQFNRMYAMGLLALSTGKQLLVRYPDVNLQCPPAANRNDTLGMWITN